MPGAQSASGQKAEHQPDGGDCAKGRGVRWTMRSGDLGGDWLVLVADTRIRGRHGGAVLGGEAR